jgi:hypothetical protein
MIFYWRRKSLRLRPSRDIAGGTVGRGRWVIPLRIHCLKLSMKCYARTPDDMSHESAKSTLAIMPVRDCCHSLHAMSCHERPIVENRPCPS